MATHQQQETDIVVDTSTVLRPRSFASEAVVYSFIDKQRLYLSKWVIWVADYTLAMLHQDITDTLQETEDGTFFLFDIFYNGEFVGAINAQDVVFGESAEVGYYIGEEFTGKGLATLCTQKVIDFLVDHSRIHRFKLEITEGNTASVRVAEKLGFRYASKRYDDQAKRHELTYEKVITASPLL